FCLGGGELCKGDGPRGAARVPGRPAALLERERARREAAVRRRAREKATPLAKNPIDAVLTVALSPQPGL
ncbi:hypothetical protein AAER91_27465, partial [Klebsiella pneumoniae]